MLDATNPQAYEWMKDIIKYEMIDKTGVSGWMADFGEYVPFDAVCYNGERGRDVHNVYPEIWARLNKEAIEEYEREREIKEKEREKERKKEKRRNIGLLSTFLENNNNKNKINKKSITTQYHMTKKEQEKEKDQEKEKEKERERERERDEKMTDKAGDIIFFMRAAWLHSPSYSPLFWLGDQLVSWDRYDGIKSVLTSALSGGISGHSLTHSDIGGYTMEEVGPIHYTRSQELLLRWIELSAFGSCLFRSHIGSSQSTSNVQIYDNYITMSHFAYFSKIFKFLASYRFVLMKEAELLGYPVMRPMAMHYAYDPVSWSLSDQFMFGSEFLVAPVLDPINPSFYGIKGSEMVYEKGSKIMMIKVYIPYSSEWIHLWSGASVSGEREEEREEERENEEVRRRSVEVSELDDMDTGSLLEPLSLSLSSLISFL